MASPQSTHQAHANRYQSVDMCVGAAAGEVVSS